MTRLGFQRLGLAAVGASTTLLALALHRQQHHRVFADQIADVTELTLEPLTKTFFPAKWTSPGGQSQTLIGTGVRAVTFMNFHAYSMAFYLDASTRLNSSRWQTEFAPSKWSASNPESQNYYMNDLWEKSSGMSLMITPVRPTDGVHLRNGFLKLLQNRLKKEVAQQSISTDQKVEIDKALDGFKQLFPSKAISKGSKIVFSTTQDEGGLLCSIAGQEMGRIDNKILAEWFFTGYLLGDEISPSFVKSVGQGLYEFVKTAH